MSDVNLRGAKASALEHASDFRPPDATTRDQAGSLMFSVLPEVEISKKRAIRAPPSCSPLYLARWGRSF